MTLRELHEWLLECRRKKCEFRIPADDVDELLKEVSEGLQAIDALDE